MKNILENFIYQGIFQLSKIVIPIVTLPIASRALGPYGIGIYNYTYSITQYFVLFAGLGVTLYGSREIAISKRLDKNLDKLFTEIFTMKMIVSIIALVIFLIICLFSKNSLILFIQSMTILAILLDVSWFFMGIEKFRLISLANTISQLIVLVIVVLFVKTPNDLIIYVLSQALGLTVPSILTLVFIRKHVKFEYKNITLNRIIIHFKNSVSFFLPQISVMFYSNLNKTLLGLIVGATAVGYYSNSLTINTVFITLLSTIDTVLLPKISSITINNSEKTILDYLRNFCNLQFYFSIALFFGILIVYDKLIPWFLGNEFKFVNNIMPLFSILILVNPLAGSIARQYLLPTGNTKLYNISAVYGALISVIINFLLLRKLGIYGSVIAYISAEIFVLLTRLISLYKNTNFKIDINIFIKLFCCGLLMMVITNFFTKNMAANFLTNLVQFIIGLTVYIVITIILKVTPVQFIREIKNIQIK